MARAVSDSQFPPQEERLRHSSPSSSGVSSSSEVFCTEDDSKPTAKQAKLCKEPRIQRKYFWEEYTSSGFPHRVNHAATAFTTPTGAQGVISVGGYHANLAERLALRKSYTGNVFKSSAIDMHQLDYDTKEWALVEPSCTSSSSLECHRDGPFTPRCRYGHTVRYFEGCLYMVGGRNDDDLSFGTLECYNIAENTWFRIQCVNGPSSLCGQAACIMGRTMYVHGGYDEQERQFSDLLWKFDFDSRTWTQVFGLGEPVLPRDFHSITAVNSCIYLFGGRSDLFAPMFSGHSLYDKQFYAFDTKTGTWAIVETKGYRPSGRRSHVAEPYGDSIIFFGGYNAQTTNHYGDVFILNTTTKFITDVRPLGAFPSPRRRVASARVGSDFLIFGGTHSEVLEIDGKQVKELVDLSDMYILKLLTTLEQLCIMVVINHNLPQHHLSPAIKGKISLLRKTAEEQNKMLIMDESVKRSQNFSDL